MIDKPSAIFDPPLRRKLPFSALCRSRLREKAHPLPLSSGLCASKAKPCIAIICGGKSAHVSPAVLHCPRHLPSRLSRKTCHRKRASVPPGLLLPTYRCQKTVHGENVLYRNRRRQGHPAPSAILHCPRHLPSRLSARFVPGR